VAGKFNSAIAGKLLLYLEEMPRKNNLEWTAIPMKKDHPIFVQYLFKSVWKSYNYCSFLDKNGHADFCSVLKVCDICTIENK
jgi:hypothetical protein